MVSNVRYGLIGKKFRHKWLSWQSQHLTEQKFTDIHRGHRTDQPRYANVAQLTNDRYEGACEKSPRVSASASLMRAPVFHSVASSILRCRSGT